MVVNAHHLLSYGPIVVITCIRKILSSSLWNTLVSILLFWVGQTIYRTITIYILFSNLDSASCWRISEVIMAHVVALTEAFIHPTLITSSIALLTILFVSRVIVHSISVFITCTHMLFISGATIELHSFLLFKIAIFSKLVVRVIFGVVDVQFPLIFWLFHSRLGIYRWEWNVLVLWIEGEQWDCPVATFIIPLWLIVQLVQFVFRKENAHNFVAELNSLFLTSNNVKQFRFLLLMFLG